MHKRATVASEGHKVKLQDCSCAGRPRPPERRGAHACKTSRGRSPEQKQSHRRSGEEHRRARRPEAGPQSKRSLNREDGVTDNTLDILEELRISLITIIPVRIQRNNSKTTVERQHNHLFLK